MSVEPPPRPAPYPAPNRDPAYSPAYSIVVPVFNEEGAASALAYEIAAAFCDHRVEILFVDDASADRTREVLALAARDIPALRILAHRRNAGQSRAIRTGVLAATAPIVVTLDGDGQNDPGDAPRLAQKLSAAPSSLGLIGGVRARRRDSTSKRVASRVANAVRRRVLDDGAQDSGCGLKAFRRDAYLRLPYFDHNHRYLPALMLREGFQIAFESVNHRQRHAGQSKYTNWGRLWAAVSDLAGVLWLRSRTRDHGGVDHI